MPFNQIIVLFTKLYQNFSLLNANSSLMLSLTNITIAYQFDECCLKKYIGKSEFI